MNPDAQPLSLRTNFTWIFAGNLVYAAGQWATLMLLAKLANPVMLGQFALGLAISTPVFMLANLSLRNVLVTDAREKTPFGGYLGLGLITTPLALLVVVGITLACDYSGETTKVVLAVALAKAMESISLILYGLMQRQERMDRVGRSQVLRGFLPPLGMGLCLWLTGEVLWGTLAMAAAWGLVMAAHDLPGAAQLLAEMRRKHSSGDTLKPLFDPGILRNLLVTAFPLGLTFMFVALNTNMPRYFFDEHSLGIFAAVASLILVGNTVILSMGQASLPRMARAYADRNLAAFKALLLKLLALATILGVCGLLLALLAGGPILQLLFTAEIAEHTHLLNLLVIAAILEFNTAVLGTAVTATRSFGRLLVAFAAVAPLALLLSALLIPARGLPGAAWALMGTNFAIGVAMLIILKLAWASKGRSA
jgi:O-antigen/teichoic acid export membrane protein